MADEVKQPLGMEPDDEEMMPDQELEVPVEAALEAADAFAEELAQSASELENAIIPEGEAAPEFNEEKFDPAALTEEQIKNGLQGLAGGLATAQDVENAARSEEGLPPIQQTELPLDFGPFNPDQALKVIFEKTAEIKELQDDYNAKKEEASDAKKELDKANTALVNIIESLKARRNKALNPTQPYLREASTDASAQSSSCPWERDHPGKTCPICSEAQRQSLQPAVDSEVHPEHEGHANTAEAAFVHNTLEPLANALEENRNLYVATEELEALAAEDLQSLIDWEKNPGPIPPQIVAKSCVAAEPGTLIQACRNCGSGLSIETDGWYPVDAWVGFECQKGQDVVTATSEAAQEAAQDTPATEAADAAPEPARQLPKRGGKKGGKKQPEAERAKQVAAAKSKVH